MKLFTKIFIAVLVLYISTICFITVFITDNHVRHARETLLEKQKFLGMMVSSEIQRWQSEQKWPFLALNKLELEKGFQFWWIVNHEGVIHLADDSRFVGTLAASYMKEVMENFIPPDEKGRVQVIPEKQVGIFYQSFSVGHSQWSFFFGLSTGEIQKTRKNIIISAATALTISIMILILFLFAAIHYFLRPLGELNDGLKKIGQGNLSFRFDKTQDDELGFLAGSINEMARKLKLREEERDHALKQIRSLRNYLSNIINSMPSVLIGVDKEDRVTLWNIKAQDVSGISSDKAQGRPLSQVFPLMSDEAERIKAAVQTRRIIRHSRQDRKDGERTRYEDVTIYPLTANGIEGAVIRVDDITDKVQMEEMMVQSEKMLSVGGLAAGMAHEINNPLAGMMQTASVMSSRIKDMEMPANQRAAKEVGVEMEDIKNFMEKRNILRMVDAINESGRRVVEIVDNMLGFARKSEAIVSSHEPEILMDQILELAATDYDLKKEYDFKTIKIIKEYEKDLPMIPCEGAKIQQVLLNILRNGAQAMQLNNVADKKEPCFRLRMSLEKETQMLKIEIEDNGPGMDKETRSRIFEPFFTTKPPGVGTGLGLSVSYFIIKENHGGTIDIDSKPGRGARFTIRLPLDRKGEMDESVQ